jgi:hypothetical protein
MKEIHINNKFNNIVGSTANKKISVYCVDKDSYAVYVNGKKAYGFMKNNNDMGGCNGCLYLFANDCSFRNTYGVSCIKNIMEIIYKAGIDVSNLYWVKE